ncbi:MAG: hypothetical protein EB149_05345 [Thaumarchaeota archaeon]|nr:hypothetical protein [Nitrososphaerota archaeon]
MIISDYDPLIVVNEKISIVNDYTQYETNQIRALLNSWINQTPKESEIRKDYCEICATRGVPFQGHHIAGEKHDDRQNTTCIPCHSIITKRQKIWDARWDEKTDSETLKIAFFYRGLYEILILMAEKRQNSLYARIADSLIDPIAYLMRYEQN